MYSIKFLKKEIISRVQLRIKFLNGINSLKITRLMKLDKLEKIKIPCEGTVGGTIIIKCKLPFYVYRAYKRSR